MKTVEPPGAVAWQAGAGVDEDGGGSGRFKAPLVRMHAWTASASLGEGSAAAQARPLETLTGGGWTKVGADTGADTSIQPRTTPASGSLVFMARNKSCSGTQTQPYPRQGCTSMTSTAS